jgi:hypothetical protein
VLPEERAPAEPEPEELRCSRCGREPTDAERPLPEHGWIRAEDAFAGLWICPACVEPENETLHLGL